MVQPMCLFSSVSWALRRLGRVVTAAAVLAFVACSHAPPAAPTADASDEAQAWEPMALPGKRSTRYEHAQVGGRPVIRARADASASMYRRPIELAPGQLGMIDFSWWVPALIPTADLADREAADSPVRVVLAFDGDTRKLSSKDRMMFELAETLTGRAPPYATLMYVWDNQARLETVIPGGRSDRIRKIVVDSGPSGLKAWRSHRRDIVRDFERAFGEPPGRLIGLALMTDSDNTGSRAQAVYGPLSLTSPDGTVSVFDE